MPGASRWEGNVHIGYYDQEHHVLDMEKTIFQEISDAFPDLTGTRIRNVLAAFLFTGDGRLSADQDLKRRGAGPCLARKTDAVQCEFPDSG